MKEKTHILSKMDTDIEQVISIVACKQYLAYDVVAIQFKKSITYQLFRNIELEFYFMKPNEIIEMWNQEQKMDEYLEIKIRNSNNKLVELGTKEIKDNLKRKAFLEEKSIDVVYDEFIHHKDIGLKEVNPKRKVKKVTPCQK